jgi:regulation of enolase protein 1 (concanavalin A-like superfamily)
VINPALELWNAPRLLMNVNGDFVAEVGVSGRLLPGTEPLELPPAYLAKRARNKPAGKEAEKKDQKADDKAEKRLPNSFQAAGLLLWLDKFTFIQIGRAGIFDTFRKRRLHQIVCEFCDNGRPEFERKDVREGDVILRLERRGEEIRCKYSRDGRDWLEVKRANMPLPAAVQVGVWASNASTNPLRVRFENFSLNRP